MKTRFKILAAVPAVCAAAAGTVMLAGKELYTYAIERDNSHSLMKKIEKPMKPAQEEQALVPGELPVNENGEKYVSGEYYDMMTKAGVDWFLEQNPQEVSVLSYDGLRLAGYYLPGTMNKTMVIMHGYRVQNITDMAHTYRHLHELGYNLLVPYQRAHGKSEGTQICYGVKERYDVETWCRFALDRYGEKQDLYLMGISMGAATVLMASGVELPRQVKAIIADCGFTSPKAEFEQVLIHNGINHGSLLIKAAEFFCKKKGGYDFEEYSTLEALKKNKRPVLFIHGAQDEFVPTFFTEQNYEACRAPKRVIYVKGARHATSGLMVPKEYFNAIDTFLADVDSGAIFEENKTE